MSYYEPLILDALSHQWQTTKKISANIPANIEARSLIRTVWQYLSRMEKAGLVEV